ncbi:hypothetical protein ACGIF2_05355 [Cellulomonas sp. P22]|uniref:hypothetical protein n=1 Tax=Cellulomonas sp. P22 TaxID=3373189 RepID=UPI0037AD2C45
MHPSLTYDLLLLDHAQRLTDARDERSRRRDEQPGTMTRGRPPERVHTPHPMLLRPTFEGLSVIGGMR